MPSVRGGKFTRGKLEYDSLEQFEQVIATSREIVFELHGLIGITQNDWMRYFNLEVEEGIERDPILDTPYDPPQTFP